MKRHWIFVVIGIIIITNCVINIQAFNIYDPIDYGATNDGYTLCTEAIQNAIDDCSADTNGIVRLTGGKFLSGTIFMKNGVTLNLTESATLLGSTNLADYPVTIPNFSSYTDNYTVRSIIYGENLTNIAITGKGIIYGQGKYFRGNVQKERPYGIRFITCRNVKVENITLTNSAMWMQHYLACDNVTISGIKVWNYCNSNNDAIDIDGCHDVLIEDCITDSDDDGITLKSTSPRLCENITIKNCTISSHNNAIKFGTESTGGLKNLHISNCIIKPSDYKSNARGDAFGWAGVALEIVDGGIMDQVVISNMQIQGTTAPIFIRLGNRARKYMEGVPTPGIGIMSNIFISDIYATCPTNMGCAIAGLSARVIKDLTFKNIFMSFSGGGTTYDRTRHFGENEAGYPECNMFGNRLPAYGLYFWNVDGLKLENINLTTENSDQRSDIVMENVKNVYTNSDLTVGVYITNESVTVNYDISSYTIGGTNNVYIVGTMKWTNNLTGISGTIAATDSWKIENIILNLGSNTITVTGTNIYGDIASSTVTITRLNESKTTLHVSDNGRYIVNDNGDPVFLQCDWGIELPWKLNTADATTYLNNRAQQGFNVIAMLAVDNIDVAADYSSFQNTTGVKPFQLHSGGDYNNRWDVTKPIEAYWNHIDTIINIAATQGMYIAIAPLPTSGLLLSSDRCMARSDDDSCYAFGNWLGKRYATKTNIIWLTGVGAPANDTFDVSGQVNAFAKGIADGVNNVSSNVGTTDYSTTFMTYTSERWSYSSSHWFHNQDWLDFNTVYEVPGKSDDSSKFQRKKITNDYALAPVKPTLLLGPVFENQRSDGSFGAPQSRFQIYQSFLAGGAVGVAYGNRDVVGFDSGWESELSSTVAGQIQYAKAVLAPLQSTLTPDQSLIVGDTGSINQGESGSGWYMSGSTIIQAARTANDCNVVIYSAYGNDITVKMSNLNYGNSMKAEWFNLHTGVKILINNSIQSGAGAPEYTFDPPGEPAQDNDAVLVLTYVVPEPTFLVGGLLFMFAFFRYK